MKYVKRRAEGREFRDSSWHLFKVFSRSGMVFTYCGRRFHHQDLVEQDDLPSEKTCEVCYRVFDS